MGYDEIRATERWLELRKRLAIRMMDTMQSVVTQMEAGSAMDQYTFIMVKEISDYCDKVLLKPTERN
ncbi:hypothetical protein PP749_gp018 [Rhizobium phage RHEph22]|uniref:Uncharacterized protein n=1 Tax=Rhizobium phage RHEph22 TaxID=2836135 RepID=A0AAE8AWM0_9CAUD|nr:hypothetical protein PP749_gp018 [Rhizobium phage RHEph22]QXV74691.1 hypothetical protein [Rhizobium phage RHEph22]QXV74787.1 hypothetical protein [Rhizobium phage RHEph24]